MVVGVSPFAVGVVGGKGGVVMMMVRWMDGLGAHPTTQIEIGPRARALFVAHDLGPYPSQPACWRNGSLRKVTTTPSYTDSQHGAKRPGAGGRSTPGTQGKHRVTQPIGRRTYGGWSWEALARCASIHGGNTPLGGGSNHPDGTRTTARPGGGSDQDRGAFGRTAMPWWLGPVGRIKRPADCKGRV